MAVTPHPAQPYQPPWTLITLIAMPLIISLSSCANPQAPEINPMHIQKPATKPAPLPQAHRPQETKPEPVQSKVKIVPDNNLSTVEQIKLRQRISVAATNLPARTLLLGIARDTGVNIDLDAKLTGNVSLSAHNQPIINILERIARQIGAYIEKDAGILFVHAEGVFPQRYHINYLNMERQLNSSTSTNTQVTNNTRSIDQNSPGNTNNTSYTRIDNKSSNNFWEALEKNITKIINEQGIAKASGAHRLISHRDSGILVVYTGASQHRLIKDFIHDIQQTAERQVLLEATIVEVKLADHFQQGIDWSRLSLPGVSLQAAVIASSVQSIQTPFTLRYDSLNVASSIRLLEEFGTVKVISSPKLAVLNNQTALFKVVDEHVYFDVKSQTISAPNTNTITTYTSSPQSVSVGIIMSITPQISARGDIILNVRPTVSSISDIRADPNPALLAAGIGNPVPQIRTREIESVIRLKDNQIAVLGGLMDDRIDFDLAQLPVLGNAPVIGETLRSKANSVAKTELVIFLRPILQEAAQLEIAQQHLPDADYLRTNPPPGERNFPLEKEEASDDQAL